LTPGIFNPVGSAVGIGIPGGTNPDGNPVGVVPVVDAGLPPSVGAVPPSLTVTGVVVVVVAVAVGVGIVVATG
jgi:hypothetical protein